jgi:hypothetical protein
MQSGGVFVALPTGIVQFVVLPCLLLLSFFPALVLSKMTIRMTETVKSGKRRES